MVDLGRKRRLSRSNITIKKYKKAKKEGERRIRERRRVK
jgi:hypothetical protein